MSKTESENKNSLLVSRTTALETLNFTEKLVNTLKLLIADSIGDSTFSERRKSWKNFDRQVPLHLLRFHLERSLPQFARIVAQRLAFQLTDGGRELEVKTPFEMHELG